MMRSRRAIDASDRAIASSVRSMNWRGCSPDGRSSPRRSASVARWVATVPVPPVPGKGRCDALLRQPRCGAGRPPGDWTRGAMRTSRSGGRRHPHAPIGPRNSLVSSVRNSNRCAAGLAELLNDAGYQRLSQRPWRVSTSSRWRRRSMKHLRRHERPGIRLGPAVPIRPSPVLVPALDQAPPPDLMAQNRSTL